MNNASEFESQTANMPNMDGMNSQFENLAKPKM